MTEADASVAAPAPLDIEADNAAAEAFIGKWRGVPASELSTSQSFLLDLCALLGVDAPHATDEQDYMFERPVTFRHGDGSTSAGRIDLYKRGSFVLESKRLKAGAHTKGFDDALLRARSQAENYARALPAAEGRPPFVVVVDVGQRIELYSEFSRSGATYTPFPDPRSHRIALDELRRPEIRERLRRVWTDPLSLDPSRESARVTRQIAADLAELAKRLEQARHDPEAVARFLMRCLFTMFAEDVHLLPADSFRELLLKYADTPDVAMRMLAQLWHDMDTGGFSAVLATDVLRFNGKLFKTPDTLPLDRAQIQLLIKAAKAKWEHVEPAIFGTLLERALEPGERHKLGAHYTPRAYVERLVLPTVIEPLRQQWSDAHAAALTLAAEDKPKEAIAELLRFHHRLCTVRVLDPACGSGNFLYVTLEHLKRLEGEVLNALDELGHRQTGLALDGERADALAGETVDPHNLLGIELNPRAAAIAEVVLWIGYLQWHFRTRGDVNPPIPVIRDFRNIENRDAVLAYDSVEYVTDDNGVPVTRWDGQTMKASPVTGERVPDDSARKPVERYVNPRKAEWPEADFVVGNPPFIGAKSMRSALGDGYVEALRGAWPDVPESADFVMYWWHQAGALMQQDAMQGFGFITTNSIRQEFNRRVVDKLLSDSRRPLSIVFAVPDHPWVDTSDGADVRIAMTVVEANNSSGRLLSVVSEKLGDKGEVSVAFQEQRGSIHPNLKIGVNVMQALPLLANSGIGYRGAQPIGKGFVVSREQAELFGLGDPHIDRVLRPYRNGRDIVDRPRDVYVIDFYGLSAEESRRLYPSLYQWVLERVKPEREQNKRATYREKWWLFGEPVPATRSSIKGLRRYIVTCMTAKHRLFQFLDCRILPDQKLITVALEDGRDLGVLSSLVHVVWALATGGNLGVGNDPVYVKGRSFEAFPFPDFRATDKFAGLVDGVESDGHEDSNTYSECTSDRVRSLGEQLDTHRKRQQAAHPGLTLTGVYNVLDKLRSGETLTAKERGIHEHGLVSVLRQLHDELDEAVLAAYGWSDLLPLLRIAHGNDAPADGHTRDDAKRAFDEAILERLVALNAQRAAAEARGEILWLRPAFQNPSAKEQPTQQDMAGMQAGGEEADSPIPGATAKAKPWPKDSVDQVRAIADLLTASPIPLSQKDIAAHFSARGPWKKRLPHILDMLVAVGRAQETDGQYRAL